MPPMITTISEMRRYWVSFALSTEIIVPPSTPPRPASMAPRKKAPAKTSWMLIPSAETICRSSTPARTIIPKRVRWIIAQRASPTAIATSRTKIRKKGYERSDNGEVDALREDVGRRERLGDPAEVGERLVGDDDPDRDRDQRLSQVLPLVPAQEELLHDEPDHADAERGDDERDDPVPEARLRRAEGRGRLAAGQSRLQLEREEAGEHVQRAVRHVHHAHEPEDEREAARDDEVEAGEREAVQPDDHEGARVAVGLVGDPDGDEDERERDGDANGERARREGGQTRAPARFNGSRRLPAHVSLSTASSPDDRF